MPTSNERKMLSSNEALKELINLWATVCYPVNTKHLYNIQTMLGRVVQMSCNFFVFGGYIFQPMSWKTIALHFLWINQWITLPSVFFSIPFFLSTFLPLSYVIIYFFIAELRSYLHLYHWVTLKSTSLLPSYVIINFIINELRFYLHIYHWVTLKFTSLSMSYVVIYFFIIELLCSLFTLSRSCAATCCVNQWPMLSFVSQPLSYVVMFFQPLSFTTGELGAVGEVRNIPKYKHSSCWISPPTTWQGHSVFDTKLEPYIAYLIFSGWRVSYKKIIKQNRCNSCLHSKMHFKTCS